MRPVECELLGISARAYDYVRKCEGELEEVFAGIEDVEGAGQARVLAAFQQEGIALRHFASTTGYGYDDIGRDALDRVFAAALEAEDALVRPQ